MNTWFFSAGASLFDSEMIATSKGMPMLVVRRNAVRSPKFNSPGAEHPR
jgi:hypothetical protein